VESHAALDQRINQLRVARSQGGIARTIFARAGNGVAEDLIALELGRTDAIRHQIAHECGILHLTRQSILAAELVEHHHQHQANNQPDGDILANIVHALLLLPDVGACPILTRSGFLLLAEEIHFAAAITRCLRLPTGDRCESFTHRRHVFVKAVTLKHLDQKMAAWLEMILGKLQRQFAQINAASLISHRITGDIGRHITNHKIHLPLAQQVGVLLEYGLFSKIPLNKLNTRNEGHFEHIEREDPPLVSDQLGSHLRPAARRSAQIGDPHARLDQFVFVVDFKEFVRRASAVAVFLRHVHIMIVHMFLQPGVTGFGSSHRIECFVW